MNPPLKLNAQERSQRLLKAGLPHGWLLLNVSEMFELRKTMDACQAENNRLNRDLAGMIADRTSFAASMQSVIGQSVEFLKHLLEVQTVPAAKIDLVAVVGALQELEAALNSRAQKINGEKHD